MDHDSRRPAETQALTAHTRSVIPASIALGVIWNVLALHLMGGRLVDALTTSWLPAGAIAGTAAGTFTIWSRLRRDGRENLLDGVATYYLGIVVYWISFVVIQRAVMCVQWGGWTNFDIQDHLQLIFTFLVYGTIWYGIILIPLTFLSRYVIWKTYSRDAV